jgi:cell division protein FtsB
MATLTKETAQQNIFCRCRQIFWLKQHRRIQMKLLPLLLLALAFAPAVHAREAGVDAEQVQDQQAEVTPATAESSAVDNATVKKTNKHDVLRVNSLSRRPFMRLSADD